MAASRGTNPKPRRRLTLRTRKKGAATIPFDGGTLDKDDVQDRYLASMKGGQVPISVFLINGVRLTGTIEFFDAFTVLLRDSAQPERGQQLIYKKMVATMVPTRERESSTGGDRRS